MFDLTPRPTRRIGLDADDLRIAATDINVPEAAVHAVADVESAGGGFLPSGRPKILFEGHIFSRLTRGKYDRSNPTISYPKWTKKFYKGGEAEYQRLSEAIQLDEDAALKSASWGRFQILGLNYISAGCASVQQFVERAFQSETNQLVEFCDYLKTKHLDKALRDKNFRAFAAAYNGPAYRENGYDTRIAAAFAKYSKVSPPASSVKPSASVAGPTQPSETVTNSQTPSVSTPQSSEGGPTLGSLSESFDSTVNKVSVVQDKIDSVSTVVKRAGFLKRIGKYLLAKIAFLGTLFETAPEKYWPVLIVGFLIVAVAIYYRKEIVSFVRSKI